MDTWIKQKGYPVVYIADNDLQARDGSKRLLATQKRFLRDIRQGTKQFDDEAKGYVLNFNFKRQNTKHIGARKHPINI